MWAGCLIMGGVDGYGYDWWGTVAPRTLLSISYHFCPLPILVAALLFRVGWGRAGDGVGLEPWVGQWLGRDGTRGWARDRPGTRRYVRAEGRGCRGWEGVGGAMAGDVAAGGGGLQLARGRGATRWLG